MFAHCVPFPAPGPPRTKTTVGRFWGVLLAAAVVLDAAVPWPMMRRRLRKSRDDRPLSMHRSRFGTPPPPEYLFSTKNETSSFCRRGSFFLSLSLSLSLALSLSKSGVLRAHEPQLLSPMSDDDMKKMMMMMMMMFSQKKKRKICV